MGGAPVTPPSSSSAPQPPPPRAKSPYLSLQPPLSRRGKGPGLILVLDHYALIEWSEGCVDPPPLQKWAEEGFAVVQVRGQKLFRYGEAGNESAMVRGLLCWLLLMFM
jgi:carboxymethylenebutenolidase